MLILESFDLCDQEFTSTYLNKVKGKAVSKKTISLGIDKFAVIPAKLAGYGKSPKAIEFETDELFHHYYIAKYGDANHEAGVYEYEKFLVGCRDWRYQGGGIGRDKESKRNVSNELAKGFTRWFLYAFEGITYFDPFEEHFKRIYQSNGSRWHKLEEGDLPDYVCGPDHATIRLAEAKGRYSSVNFTNKAFEEFRRQIKRVALKDARGQQIRVEGYVSACQWATEETPRTMSKLLVEDPATEGQARQDGEYPHDIGLQMVAGHYVAILERLMLSAHAEALRRNSTVPESIGHRLPVWEVVVGPLKGARFVGGLIPNQIMTNDRDWCYYLRWGNRSPFLRPPATLFAVEEKVFTRIMGVCTTGIEAANDIPMLGDLDDLPPRMTVFRDGTLIAPVSYLRWIGEIAI